VAAAQAEGRPVVALESTIITHGMPYPQNLETARAGGGHGARGRRDARDHRRDGRAAQCRADGRGAGRRWRRRGTCSKLSRADLAVCLADGRDRGATTVAATMIVAHRAGIAVFATGGIGGVHRGAEESFDISADLRELAETPVTVVAAGAKAILDLPKTLEVLETLGRAGDRGRTGRLPRLLVARQRASARRSGSTPPRRSQRRTGCAAHSACPAGSWWPIPIPAEAEIPAETLAPLIAEANAQAVAKGVSGKDVTPFLLQWLFERTEGRTLEANIALVMNNARLAARIARALAN
jgi:pseudouridine-5'-phosphate glycosidase